MTLACVLDFMSHIWTAAVSAAIVLVVMRKWERERQK